jgi:hypothetical protein
MKSTRTVYQKKLALTSTTSNGSSVGVLRLRTKSQGAAYILHYVVPNYVPGQNRSTLSCQQDRLCGLVIRLPGCLPRGPGFDSRRY